MARSQRPGGVCEEVLARRGWRGASGQEKLAKVSWASIRAVPVEQADVGGFPRAKTGSSQEQVQFFELDQGWAGPGRTSSVVTKVTEAADRLNLKQDCGAQLPRPTGKPIVCRFGLGRER